MADWECWPLWEVAPEVGNIDPATLPLSKATQQRLKRWAEALDAVLDQTYPPDSRFPTPAQRQAFKQEGRGLLVVLRQKLGDGYRVIYHDWV